MCHHRARTRHIDRIDVLNFFLPSIHCKMPTPTSAQIYSAARSISREGLARSPMYSTKQAREAVASRLKRSPSEFSRRGKFRSPFARALNNSITSARRASPPPPQAPRPSPATGYSDSVAALKAVAKERDIKSMSRKQAIAALRRGGVSVPGRTPSPARSLTGSPARQTAPPKKTAAAPRPAKKTRSFTGAERRELTKLMRQNAWLEEDMRRAQAGKKLNPSKAEQRAEKKHKEAVFGFHAVRHLLHRSPSAAPVQGLGGARALAPRPAAPRPLSARVAAALHLARGVPAALKKNKYHSLPLADLKKMATKRDVPIKRGAKAFHVAAALHRDDAVGSLTMENRIAQKNAARVESAYEKAKFYMEKYSKLKWPAKNPRLFPASEGAYAGMPTTDIPKLTAFKRLISEASIFVGRMGTRDPRARKMVENMPWLYNPSEPDAPPAWALPIMRRRGEFLIETAEEADRRLARNANRGARAAARSQRRA